MSRHRSGDKPSDHRGRTWTGRVRDTITDGDSDHGVASQATGKRAERRAGHTAIVKTTWYGKTTVERPGQRSGRLQDRWS